MKRDEPVHAANVLPLLPNDYHILFSLLDGPLHGYAISRSIRLETGGQIRIEAANLQRTVQKLMRRGLVSETDWRPDPAVDDRRRRYYVITDLGKRVVAADASRMRAIVRSAEARDLIPGGGG